MRIIKNIFKFRRNFNEHKKRNLKCDFIFGVLHKAQLTHYIAPKIFQAKQKFFLEALSTKGWKRVPFF